MENNYELNIVSLETDRDAEASAESQSESSSLSNSLKSRGDDADSNLVKKKNQIHLLASPFRNESTIIIYRF